MTTGSAPGGILTLDLASRTGWAYGHAAARLTRPAAFGYWDLKKPTKRSLAPPWADLIDKLADSIKVLQPSLVVFEAPLPPAAQNHERTARLLFGHCSMAELVCYRWEIECQEENAQTVRKQLIGKGRPDKDEIVQWCRGRGLDITDHNAADAVVLWYYAAALRS